MWATHTWLNILKLLCELQNILQPNKLGFVHSWYFSLPLLIGHFCSKQWIELLCSFKTNFNGRTEIVLFCNYFFFYWLSSSYTPFFRGEAIGKVKHWLWKLTCIWVSHPERQEWSESPQTEASLRESNYPQESLTKLLAYSAAPCCNSILLHVLRGF